MFASNFPVDGLCGTFRTIFDGFFSITAGFSERERKALFHDNAVRIYGMNA
jgi:predicted TIM-barrel fold metal-dependent hydrolase